LNKNNIKTKKNKAWTNKTIINTLSNPNYIGNVRYGINTNKYFEIEGRHKSIISKKDYEIAQIKLKNRLRTKEDAYYSNKLICLCQNKMYTKRTYMNKKCYINYKCKNYDCPIKSISHNKLDKYLKINKLELTDKKFFVQAKVKKIIILSKKKCLLTMYNYVNKNNVIFTLYKK